VLKEQAFYMPKERRDIITGRIIAEPANWTSEEILVWLDYQDKRDKELDNRLESKFCANGNRYIENSYRDIWSRVADKVARDSEQYIL
jgi:hypothetical protein